MKYIKQSLLLLAIATACGSFLHAGKLHDLVEKGDVKKVEQFLNNNKNIDVNQTGQDDNPPLLNACIYGHFEITKILISHNVDINKPGRKNATPLWATCRYGYFNIAKLLIEQGAHKNTPDCNNDTPLLIACIYKHFKIVKLLLSHGADINTPNRNNKTPFNEIKKWSIEEQSKLLKELLYIKQKEDKPKKQSNLFKQLLSFNFKSIHSIQPKKTGTDLDTNTHSFIELNAAAHADSFTQNKTLVPFIITDTQRKDLLSAEGFKDVKNKEFIISIGEDLLNNLFFRFEKNKNNTLPVFVFEQPKTIHPYVKQLKIQRDTQVFKNHNIKSYDDLSYKIKLLAFAQKSWKKWNKKQKSKVQFEDVTLNFKSDNSDS